MNVFRIEYRIWENGALGKPEHAKHVVAVNPAGAAEGLKRSLENVTIEIQDIEHVCLIDMVAYPISLGIIADAEEPQVSAQKA